MVGVEFMLLKDQVSVMRIVSLSSFIVLVSLGFMMGGILDLSPVTLEHS